MPNPNIAQAGRNTRWTSETAPRRVSLGASVNEWRNTFGNYKPEQLQAVIDDPKSTVAQLMAAKEAKRAIDGDGDMPTIAQACEFTHAKPKAVTVTHEQVHIRRSVVIRDADGNTVSPDAGRN